MWCRFLFALCVMAPGMHAVAEDAPVTAESVQARLAELEKSTTLSEDTKDDVRDFYQRALAELELAAKDSNRAEQFSETARRAPEDLGRIRRDLALLPPQPRVDLPDYFSLEQLQQRLAERQATIEQFQLDLENLNSEPKHRATRRSEIPKQRAAARKELDEVQRQLDAEPDPEQPIELAQARRTYLLAKAGAREKLLASGANELEAYQATIDLLPLRRDLAAAELALVQREAAVLQSEIKRRRASEVNEHQRQAESRLAEVPQSLESLARLNLQLVERRREVRGKQELILQKLADVEQTASELEQQRNRIERKVEAVGLIGGVGLLLRKQKTQLPDVSSYRREVRQRQPDLRDAQLAALELEDRRSDLADLDAAVDQAAKQLGGLSSEPARAKLRRLLLDERRYTDHLVNDLNAYVDQLLQLAAAQRDLVSATEEFSQFIDERVLWVRSANTFSMSDLPVALEAAGQLADARQWRRMTIAIAIDFFARFMPYLLVLAILVAARLVGWQMTLRRRHARAPDERPSRLKRLVSDTFEIVLCTAPVPLLLWLFGNRMSSLPDSQFAHAMGTGLTNLARDLLPLILLLRICRQGGFARRHLGWSDEGTAAIRRYLVFFMLLALPLAFLRGMYNALEVVRFQDSLGRICFVLNVFIVVFFVERLLRPRSGLLYRTVGTFEGDWLSRLSWLWYVVGIGSHLSLAVIALIGYTYAADRLGELLRATALLLVCLLLFGSLLMHWARLNARRLAIRRATTRSPEEEAAAAAAAEWGLPLPRRASSWFQMNTSSSSKMRPLVSTVLVIVGLVGLWMIWVDVVPALGVVNKVDLWYTELPATRQEAAAISPVPTNSTSPVPNSTSPPNGQTSSIPVTQPATVRVPVTLGDVLWAVFLLVATVFATRYIGALFELPLLERLPLDSALENSITTVARYAMWIVAVIAAAAYLGIGWNKVQWMVAALSLGLGFGLQEIFANFISGLILLFERPMRVGDIITIGDTTGVVQAIRMRATTIMDWDRKELVVPNKEFATGRLLNWTLTNKTNRRVIRVAVAYGTEPNRVRDLLLKVAAESSRVLDSPKPIALLEEFGESALIFSLRVYHPKISDRLRGLHELNTAIQREFNNAGIEFAFPQRDLHVRDVPSFTWFGPDEEKGTEEDEAGVPA